MCKRTLGVKKTLCSGTAKRRDVSERDTLGPMPAHVPSEAMEHTTKKPPSLKSKRLQLQILGVSAFPTRDHDCGDVACACRLCRVGACVCHRRRLCCCVRGSAGRREVVLTFIYHHPQFYKMITPSHHNAFRGSSRRTCFAMLTSEGSPSDLTHLFPTSTHFECPRSPCRDEEVVGESSWDGGKSALGERLRRR